MAGELDAGNPHVQFDEGAQETCDSATPPVPYSKMSNPPKEFIAADPDFWAPKPKPAAAKPVAKPTGTQ
jgi:hypothetical protein